VGLSREENTCPRCEELDALEKYITEDGALLWICTFHGCGFRTPVQDTHIID
jgi:hypothetical protein